MFLSPNDFSTPNFWASWFGLSILTAFFFLPNFIFSIGFWPFLVLVVAECWIGLANTRRIMKNHPEFIGYLPRPPGQHQLSHSIRNSCLYLCLVISHSVLLSFLYWHFSNRQNTGMFLEQMSIAVLFPTILFFLFAFIGATK